MSSQNYFSSVFVTIVWLEVNKRHTKQLIEGDGKPKISQNLNIFYYIFFFPFENTVIFNLVWVLGKNKRTNQFPEELLISVYTSNLKENVDIFNSVWTSSAKII